MRVIVLLSFVSAAGFASASFDLILVSDSTKKVIHRYDGDSGTYLGSFGAGFIGTTGGLALDQANNLVMIQSFFGVSAFDYNTGAHLWTNSNFGVVHPDMAYSGNTLFRAGMGTSTSAVVFMANPQTAISQATYSGPYGSYTGVGIDSSNQILAYNSTSGRVCRWTSGSTGSPTATSAVLNLEGGLDVRGSTCLGLGIGGKVISIDTGTMAATIGYTPSQGAFTSSADVAFGHNNLAWGLGLYAGGTVLQSYNRNADNIYVPGGRYSLSQVTTPVSMVVVLAPEPGSLAALGLGLVVLLRRKK